MRWLVVGLLLGLTPAGIGLLGAQLLSLLEAILAPAPGRGRRPVAFRYRAAPLLVNEGERAAWHLLSTMPLGAQAVCPKVRLEDIAEAAGQDRWRLRGYTRARHVDFLLVDARWQPLLVVEVDGGSHDRRERRRADDLKDRVLASAGIAVLRLRVGTDWRAQLAAWAAPPPVRGGAQALAPARAVIPPVTRSTQR